jgi:serine/threonine-protein kinase
MQLCPTCGRLEDDGVHRCPEDGGTLAAYAPAIPVGEVVADKYRILRPVGVGPSGEVYEAAEETHGGRVVVRLLSSDVSKDRRLSDVVRRHLTKQQSFEHRYCVPVRAVGTFDERILLVRDRVEGRRLEDVLRTERALPAERVLAIALRLCTALADAHRVGLLHLQIRASNVFLVPSDAGAAESVRLVDFGVGPRRKVGGRPVYGFPATVAPEQLEAKIVSFKSDIFSTGLLLYRMLCGRPAFAGTDDEAAKALMNDPLPPLRDPAGRPIAPPLDALVHQLTERKPIHRPIGMPQVIERIRALQADEAHGRTSIEPEAAIPPDAEVAPPKAVLARIALRPKDEAAAAGEAGPPAGAAPPAGDGKGLPGGGPVEDAPAPSSATMPLDIAQLEEVAEEAASRGARAKPATGEGAPDGGDVDVDVEEAGAAVEDDAILESAVVPPPLDLGPKPPPPPGAPRVRAAEADSPMMAAYRRGLFHGLAAGVALAIILFFLALFFFRRPAEPAAAFVAGTSPPHADAGDTSPGSRVVATGEMQVTGDEDPRPPETSDGGATGEEPAGDGSFADAGSEAGSEPEETADAETPGSTREADVRAAPADAVVRPADVGSPSRDVEAAPPARDAGTTTPPRDAGATTPPRDAGTTTADLEASNAKVEEGDRALGQRNYAAARAAFEEALRLNSRNNRARIGLGRTAFQQQDFETAVTYLEGPYRNQGNMELGTAYVRVGRLADAKRQFELLLERSPDNEAARRALDAVLRQMGN